MKLDKQKIIKEMSEEHGITKVAAKAIFEQIVEDLANVSELNNINKKTNREKTEEFLKKKEKNNGKKI